MPSRKHCAEKTAAARSGRLSEKSKGDGKGELMARQVKGKKKKR